MGLFSMDASTRCQQRKGHVEVELQLLSVSTPNITIVIHFFISHGIVSKYRCTPCTPTCTNIEKEVKKRPPSSNFISHSLTCKSVPETLSWAAYKVHSNGTEVNSNGQLDIKALGGAEAQ
jgi:hypothetical protein